MYADYAYYRDEYLGVAIAEEDFDRLAIRAEEQVDILTRFRATSYANNVDRAPIAKATCAIAEVIQQSERAGAATAKDGGERVVVSEDAGKQRLKYSAFAVTNSAGQNVLYRQIIKAAQVHLYPTGLLNRGVW